MKMQKVSVAGVSVTHHSRGRNWDTCSRHLRDCEKRSMTGAADRKDTIGNEYLTKQIFLQKVTVFDI